MKALFACSLALLCSSQAHAASVCFYTVPSTAGDSAVVTCDGKQVESFVVHVDTDLSAKGTVVLKKLLEQGYHIATESNGDYTLVK